MIGVSRRAAERAAARLLRGASVTWRHSDDPFGLQDDRGPNPRPPAAAVRRTAAPSRGGEPIALQPRDHPNPLIGAFAALLAFAPELEVGDRPERPRDAAHAAARRPRSRRATARSRAACRSPAPTPRAWAVAALLDDLALNTPWGGSSAWPRQPLVSTLYGDVDAGTRFFERLEELERHPSRDPEMLQLYVFCLELGFRGKYRVPGRAGASSLAAVRTAAARLLRDPEAAAAPLSPNWQGVVAADAPRGFAVPGLGAVRRRRRRLRRALPDALAAPRRPGRRAGRARPRAAAGRARRDLPARRATPGRSRRRRRTETVAFDAAGRVRRPAPPRACARRSKGQRDRLAASRSSSSGRTPELFQSARAQLTEGFEPLIDSIGRVIAANQELIGNVTVVGHTDSVQVRQQPLRRQPGPERGPRRHRRATPRRQRRARRPGARRGPRRDRAGRLQQTRGGPGAEPARRDPRREAALRWWCCASSGPS